jgi:hypothetical protein
MQVPFDQVDKADERLDFLEDVLVRLGNTQIVKETKAEPLFSKLKQLIVGAKGQAASEGMGVIVNDFRTKTFFSWIKALETKYGKSIPDKFFKDSKDETGKFTPGSGSNRYGSTFEDLEAVFHILDEKLTSGPQSAQQSMQRKVEDKGTLEDFAKKNLEPAVDGPKKSWGELDKLFKQAAELSGLPEKFVHLRSLIYALKPAEAEHGVQNYGKQINKSMGW